MITGLLVAGLMSPLGSAKATGPSVTGAQTLLIDDGVRDRFGIKEVRWVEASGSTPAYAYILGCHACGPATYTPSGELAAPTTLPKIPTSYILRVPEHYEGRLVVNLPPGNFTQTFLRSRHTQWLAAGYAAAVMNHPRPGTPGFPYEQFVQPPYSTADYGREYAATGYLLRDLLGEFSTAPHHAYAVGSSRGVLDGVGILAGRKNQPFDGYVMVSGGNGRLGDLTAFTESYLTDGKVPLSVLPPDEAEVALAQGIGNADPEYRAMVLSGEASAFDYDVSTRPKAVQRSWANLDYGPNIGVPVILIHGLHDTTVWPSETLRYTQRILDAGRGNLKRLYLIKEMGHSAVDPPAPTEALFVDALRNLDAWVTAGLDPGPLNAGTLGSHPSCEARGYGADPLGCFDEVFGTGF